MMNQSWDEKYNQSEFIFGTEPNLFFKEVIDSLTPGKLLLPAEGEGRNAVYAARNRWKVDAFDTSIVGRNKALQFAHQHQVKINYFIHDLTDLSVLTEEYDVIAVIFAHLHSNFRYDVHQKLIKHLKKGGLFVLQAFNKKQLPLNTGGPKDPEMLYTKECLKKDFKDLTILRLEEEKIFLDEGPRHHGWSENILFLGKK